MGDQSSLKFTPPSRPTKIAHEHVSPGQPNNADPASSLFEVLQAAKEKKAGISLIPPGISRISRLSRFSISVWFVLPAGLLAVFVFLAWQIIKLTKSTPDIASPSHSASEKITTKSRASSTSPRDFSRGARKFTPFTSGMRAPIIAAPKPPPPRAEAENDNNYREERLDTTERQEYPPGHQPGRDEKSSEDQPPYPPSDQAQDPPQGQRKNDHVNSQPNSQHVQLEPGQPYLEAAPAPVPPPQAPPGQDMDNNPQPDEPPLGPPPGPPPNTE